MEHLLAGNKNKRHALTLTEEVTKMTALQTLSGVEICTGLAKELLRALENLTNLKKFTIYKVGELANGNDELLLSAIEHLSSCSLKHLAIDDNFTGFLDRSLNASQAPPEHLHTLGLSGLLSQVPMWIDRMHNLEKLTLSVTSLTTDTLLVLAELPELFSVTFSLDAVKSDPIVLKILHNNTLESGGKIFVLAGGFRKLKLLRFRTPVLPLLSFEDGAMPELERLELRFKMVEGVYGLENLASLQQVLLTVSSQPPEDAKAKASQIKVLASLIPNGPSLVIDEYNESSKEQ
uniref:Disease resistance R13L4/SHOC-2-like LRR domain-containing protein n=1 Tax=Arundo donax TaxID=35708 RepID=A0A0A8ZYJ1_ARUDO